MKKYFAIDIDLFIYLSIHGVDGFHLYLYIV